MGMQGRRRHTSVVLGKELDVKVQDECDIRKQKKSDFIRQVLWGFFENDVGSPVIKTDANEIKIVISFDGLERAEE